MFTYRPLESPAIPQSELSASWATRGGDAGVLFHDVFRDPVTILLGGMLGNAKTFDRCSENLSSDVMKPTKGTLARYLVSTTPECNTYNNHETRLHD